MPDSLVWKQILWVINFPPKQIWSFMSEFLCTGLYDSDGGVILATVDAPLSNGARLA